MYLIKKITTGFNGKTSVGFLKSRNEWRPEYTDDPQKALIIHRKADAIKLMSQIKKNDQDIIRTSAYDVVNAFKEVKV